MDNQFLISLTEKYGAPLYVYNADVIERQYTRMMNAFSSVKNVKLNYAVKSNTNINVLKFLKNLGSGGDCVSVQEIKLCLAAGFKVADISYTPNGVSFEEITEAHKLGVKITLDNLSSLDKFGKTFPNAPVSLRINPHIMAGGNAKISVGHVDSKFGISHTQIEEIKTIIKANGTPVNGVHMHTGSDIYNPDAFVEAMEVLLGIAEHFDTIEFVDLGSGFKVPYKDNDHETNLEELGPILGASFNAFCKKYGKELKLIFEPGKFLVSESGKFLAKVNVIKQTPNINFVGVDSGLNHLMRPMMYDAYHRVTNISNPNGIEKEYNVVGYICETDTFASSRTLGEVNEGDIICMDNAGAYCFSMASNYNSRFRPAEVLVVKGKDYLIRQRETFEDILKNQIEIDLS
ncbi:diaminopimelate decarboxylase [Wenyingzhuangia sp. 2_MG-2023]|uniref:diaminopimelate decarboxylase n=1 Tax=Wenyingzhuangia sp. 2_MG-2023 TaxID=3062639 RepID=UPI0026E1E316|nr:diaminopimelate decarboxylase [Wenyingzhuangia sp. 2_MG-2023]MDO6738873.1 diaminopimelate decarboxylase [Wenyingzhuangia sp. 2_MG-2023]MDO6803615.1 diaminopimelate decarboxylase [Wenyingzhuangia sp. 1_MG-2023]